MAVVNSQVSRGSGKLVGDNMGAGGLGNLVAELAVVVMAMSVDYIDEVQVVLGKERKNFLAVIGRVNEQSLSRLLVDNEIGEITVASNGNLLEYHEFLRFKNEYDKRRVDFTSFCCGLLEAGEGLT